MTTMTRVRQAIALSHDTIEQTDFAKSLLDGRITRSGYALYLAQIWHIHHTLESLVAATPEIASHFTPAMVRTPAIARDAQAIGYAVNDQPKLTTTSTIEQQIIDWATNSPLAVLGCIYILEGSRMGSLMIAKPLARALAVATPEGQTQNAGVEYHLEGASETPKRVKQFKAAIDTAELNAQQEQMLTLGACVFMELLLELYRSLPVSNAHASPANGSCPFMRAQSANGHRLRSA